MICVINALKDTEYYTLGLWGSPVIYYPIQAALESKIFSKVVVTTNCEYIRYLMSLFFGNQIICESCFLNPDLEIDGRAALITPEIIAAMLHVSPEGKSTVAMKNENVSFIVDSPNNFELALVLLRKRNRSIWLRKQVLNRIQEKTPILSQMHTKKEICLVGHSQFDQWNISTLRGYSVRNCGISGITSSEYIDDILKKGLLNYKTDIFCILIGVNDLLLPKTVEEIADDILTMVKYLQSNSKAKLYYLESLLVNGRLDRSNDKIVMLNSLVKSRLESDVSWIDTWRMNDDYGHLDYRYTTDGLHLSQTGYQMLEQILEHSME